jgi:hypothetical protein
MRRQQRNEESAVVQVMWTDRLGNEKFANARTVDISESGMRIEVPEQIPERSYVVLRSEKLGVNGTASVRSCMRKQAKFLIGLEFSGGLKWKPQPAKAKPKAASEHAEEPVVR